MARPGDVLISERTQALTQGLFRSEELEPATLRGWPEAVRTFRVTGAGAADRRFGPRHSESWKGTIGRAAELMLLRDRWSRAVAGEGQVVLLQGEAGIGKSALSFGFRESLRGDPHIAVLYSCSQYHVSAALWPVIAQLERAAGIAGEDSRSGHRERLENLLAEGGTTDPAAIEVVCDLLGLASGGASRIATLTPRQKKVLIFRTLLAQLEGLARRSPVLVLLEDLHWIDPTSMELFDEVVDRIRRLPVMLIATQRPDRPPPWQGLPHVTLLTIGPLPARESEELVSRAAGGKNVPAKVVELILRRTEGVPLFIEEMTKAVLEQSSDDASAMVAGESAATVPSTLHDSLMSRLDRLKVGRRVAQVAACIGRDFDHELLSRVIDEPSRMDEALEQLLDSELIFRRSSPGQRRYRFKHALVRDVAYQSLLRSNRQKIHSRIADRLIANAGEIADTGPEVVAHHLTLAERREEAVAAWQRASELALARSAMREAGQHLQTAVQLLREIPETPQTIRRELELLTPLGVALTNTLGPAAAEVVTTHNRASELAERLGNTDAWFRARWAIWRVSNARAELDRAVTIGNDLLRRADAEGSVDHRLQAHHAIWSSSLFKGDIEVTRAHIAEALSLYDVDRHSALALSYGGHDARECGLTQFGNAIFIQGCPDQAIQYNRQALEHARALRHPQIIAHCYNFSLLTLQFAGEVEELRRRSDILLELVAEYGLSIYATEARMLRAWLDARQEHDSRHVDRLESALAQRSAMGTNFVQTYFRWLIADAWLSLGRHQDARRSIERAIDEAGRTGENLWLAELYRLRARTSLAAGDRDLGEVERDLRASMSDAMSRRALWWELRAASDFGRLLHDRGDRREAQALLRSTLEKFTEGFDNREVSDAQALLSACS